MESRRRLSNAEVTVMAETNFRVKRANPRFSFFADAEAVLGDGTSVRVQLCEISSRGCYIGSLEPIPVGTGLLLRICYGMGTCELRGKVIYIHSRNGFGLFGMGILFAIMSAEQRATIDAWLSKLASKPAAPTRSRRISTEEQTDSEGQLPTRK
jgi:PilZ domain